MTDAPRTAPRSELPIACTLGPDDGPARLARWRRLHQSAPPVARLSQGELIVRYPPRPGLQEELQSLAAAEQTCCSFVIWSVSYDGDQPVLRVTAPLETPGTVVPIAAMFGAGGMNQAESQ